MKKNELRHIRNELKYSFGTYICSVGSYAVFSAHIGWSDVSFIYARKCKYGITSHLMIYDEDTEGMRLYFLNDAFAQLIGYKDLSDMKARLPSLQYHRRFISLKAIDRATVKSRKKQGRSGQADKLNRNTTPIFNNQFL